MRSVSIGRKNYLFVGSQTGGRAAAIAYTLIETAKLNDINPQTCCWSKASNCISQAVRRVHF